MAILYNNGKINIAPNKYFGGGDSILGLTPEQWRDFGLGLVPIYGSVIDIQQAYEEPSLENIGWAGLSVISEIPFLKFLKTGKLIKAGKYATRVAELTQQVNNTTKKLERMRATPNLNPKKIRIMENQKQQLQQKLKAINKRKTIEQAAQIGSIIGTSVAEEYTQQATK